MLGVGLFYTDLEQFAASVSNPTFVLICLATVLGAVLGAGLFGRLFKFNFVESSMAAGLCMANMEDLVTLQSFRLAREWDSCHLLRYPPGLVEP